MNSLRRSRKTKPNIRESKESDTLVELSPALAQKYNDASQRLKQLREMLIAYSGGVDSALLAKLAYDAVGERALAVIAVSESLPGRELQAARNAAQEIGVPLRETRAYELQNDDYAKNAPNRCYFCKDELFTQLEAVSEETGIRNVVYGANLDDTGDHRPGMQAAQKWKVHAPLLEAQMTKNDIRELSKALGLSTWNKPALACLSSRFPHGTPITAQKLSQVDAAEDCLHGLGFRQFRVRHHEDAEQTWTVARIEIAPEEMPRAFQENIRKQMAESLRKIGYRFVSIDLDGYRTGSLNPQLLSISPPK